MMRGVVVVGVAFGVVVTSGCRDPTQITLALHTTAACTDVAGTAISAGSPDEVESQAPVATTSTCTPNPEGGDIGSLVLVPANAEDAAVGVKVTLSVADTLETCLSPPYDDCIIARRSLRYIPNTPLTLPIELTLACKGKFCDAQTTCVDGECVDSEIDPNQCVDPEGCEPDRPDGGAGGEGGAGGGGGTHDCGEPVTQASEPLNNAAGTARVHLAIAADPDTCGWGVVYANDSHACLQPVGSDGKSMGAPVCRELPGDVDDVAVAALGDTFVAGAWSRAEGLAHLWPAETTAKEPTATITGVVGGALAAREDRLIVLSEDQSGNLHYTAYRSGSSLVLDGSGAIGVPGRRPHMAWSGNDLLVSWLNDPSQSFGGRVVRLIGGTLPASVDSTFLDGAEDVPASSEIVMANHAPAVAGIHFLRSASAATLDTWGTAGFVSGTSTSNASSNSTSLSIAGTATGWVVGYIDSGAVWLEPFDDLANNLDAQQELAQNAQSVALAAIGDQLAVTWIDDDGGVHLRLISVALENSGH